MTKKISWLLIIWSLFLSSHLYAAESSLLVFAGAASKPAAEEIIKIFSQEKRVKVDITFGGSGFVLAQMKIAQKGDLYFPGSSDFMEKAKREKLVYPESERIIAYLLPALNVPRGNPKQIKSLRDLAKPGLRIGIADPETVCVGTYAVEVIERNLAGEEKERVRKNIVAMVESCEKTANIVALKSVDVVIGWEVFGKWDPQRIETVLLRPEEIPRLGYLPVGISSFTKNRRLAEELLIFFTSPIAQNIFRKHGYLTTVEEAKKFAIPHVPVGGEYALPKYWLRKGIFRIHSKGEK